MQFGAYMFCTDYSIRPDELARLLEERNFESMWVPEHSHIPASRQSPWPGGAELPREYWHTYDPFVALTAAAAATNGHLDGGLAMRSSAAYASSASAKRSSRSLARHFEASSSSSMGTPVRRPVNAAGSSWTISYSSA